MDNEASTLRQDLLSIEPKNLAKAIFNSDMPEELVRMIPAQNLYMTICYNGVLSSTDLISIVSVSQRRLLMDFDCWDKDVFDEDKFFSWLSLTDEDNSLDLLKKILKSSDLKLTAFLIGKYVTVYSQEEPTDLPPDGDFYTPDKGYTWLKIETGDSDKDFLLKRLLALIFESNVELFYQITSIPTISTPTELEEQAYEEKNKRLASEGIPELEECIELNRPLNKAKILEKMKNEKIPPREAVGNILPLAFKNNELEPLTSFLNEIKDSQMVLSELTRILNACIVFYDNSFNSLENVSSLSEQVKGVLNIGLEKLLEDNIINSASYPIIDLQDIYQYGLNFIFEIKKVALKKLEIESNNHDSVQLSILDMLSKKLPALPAFIQDENTYLKDEEGKLLEGERTISSFKDVLLAKKILEKI